MSTSDLLTPDDSMLLFTYVNKQVSETVPKSKILLLAAILRYNKGYFFQYFRKSEPGQLQKNYATAWKIRRNPLQP